MPWSISQREDEWCVIKDSDGSVAGCHASRTRALAQQKALYAQEASTAAANGAPDPVRVEIASADTSAREEALSRVIGDISERLISTEQHVSQIVDVLKQLSENAEIDRTEMREALTAAANRPAPEPPVVNVDVQVPEQAAPTVNIHVPKTKLLIPSPVVNVTLPSSRKTVTFERDPLTGSVSKAQVEEEVE